MKKAMLKVQNWGLVVFFAAIVVAAFVPQAAYLALAGFLVLGVSAVLEPAKVKDAVITPARKPSQGHAA